MDFPIDRPHGPGRLLPQARRAAPSRRPGLPELQDRRPSPRPSPPPRPGPRLPLHRLRPRLQRLHRHRPGGDPSHARRDRAHPPRLRPGRPHGAAGPRAGLRPQAPAGAAPPHAGRRRAGGSTATRWATTWSRPTRCTRTPARKGSSTPTPTTRRGIGPTSGEVTAPSPTTGRRWPGWSAASRARSAWRWSPRPGRRSWTSSWTGRASRGRR